MENISFIFPSKHAEMQRSTLKKYKARVFSKMFEIGAPEYNVIVLICRVWRSFGTPFSIKNNDLKPYTTKIDAIRGADKVAADMGIELVWEVKG